MDKKFFDESIFNLVDAESELNIDFSMLDFHLKKHNNSFQFYVENKSQRLNGNELKIILKANESKKFLSENDVALLNYISHRLLETQTIYNVFNDIGFIIVHLKNSKMNSFFEDKKLEFSAKPYKLNIELKFDENNNVVLDVIDKGDLIATPDAVYFIKDEKLYTLNEKVPPKFYTEVFDGKNKFSIDMFLTLKNTIMDRLKSTQNLKISKEVEMLSNMNIEKRVAEIVIEISKTTHFIILHLKYKIGDELFNTEDYKYAETISWIDKKSLIKIVRDEEKLIQYVPDETLSEEVMRDMFDGTRIKYSPSPKSPFMVMLPISSLENFINQILPRAEDMFKIEYKNGQKLKLADGNVKFELETNLKSRLDFFEFKVRFKIENEYFDVDFLKDLMLKNKKYVQLKDGTTVNIENIREINKWIEFLKKFEFKKKDNLYQSHSTTALELDEFLKDFKEKNIKSNDEYKNMIQELKEKKPVFEVELPNHVKDILRDYQKEGVYWLHFLKKYGFNGILADEMGLGKTIQTLSILAMNQDEGAHIVICPKSLIYNWENEIRKYFPEMKILIVDGESERRRKLIEASSGYNIIITSYSMLQKDYKLYIENHLNFNYMVLDEAHYVKNMKTLSAKAVRVISSKRVLLLTGTPLENNLDELYGTFDLVMPTYLGNKLDFNRDYVSKIERNNMIALELLQAKIRPFILRRTKKEVLKELPDKVEQVVYNEMTNKQTVIYQELLNRVKMEVNELIKNQGFDKSRIQVLSALLKLRQICNHPGLLEDRFKSEENISGKYDQFLELLEEVIDSGEKVLVFSQFTSMLDIFQKELAGKKINFVRLDGSTKNRQEVVDQFQNDEKIQVFLISLKAGGVGLNLTAASAVFLYDPWWNPMVEKQAMDRAHRIGQTQTVNVYKFITKNSIEEKILKLQERKGNLFENLVTEDSGYFKRLEWEDLMELFD